MLTCVVLTKSSVRSEKRDLCGLEWNLKIYLINFKGRPMEMLIAFFKSKTFGWFV